MNDDPELGKHIRAAIQRQNEDAKKRQLSSEELLRLLEQSDSSSSVRPSDPLTEGLSELSLSLTKSLFQWFEELKASSQSGTAQAQSYAIRDMFAQEANDLITARLHCEEGSDQAVLILRINDEFSLLLPLEVRISFGNLPPIEAKLSELVTQIPIPEGYLNRECYPVTIIPIDQIP